MSERYELPNAAQLRAQRLARGLSIDQTAEFLGLEPHVYEGLEKGNRTLSKRQVHAVAILIAHREAAEQAAVVANAAETRLTEAARG